MRQATPGVLEEAPGALIWMELEWMNRLSLQKCKWSGEPGEVEVVVPLQGPSYLGPWANLFPSNLLTLPPPTKYFLPAWLQNPVSFMLPLT